MVMNLSTILRELRHRSLKVMKSDTKMSDLALQEVKD